MAEKFDKIIASGNSTAGKKSNNDAESSDGSDATEECARESAFIESSLTGEEADGIMDFMTEAVEDHIFSTEDLRRVNKALNALF